MLLVRLAELCADRLSLVKQALGVGYKEGMILFIFSVIVEVVDASITLYKYEAGNSDELGSRHWEFVLTGVNLASYCLVLFAILIVAAKHVHSEGFTTVVRVWFFVSTCAFVALQYWHSWDVDNQDIHMAYYLFFAFNLLLFLVLFKTLKEIPLYPTISVVIMLALTAVFLGIIGAGDDSDENGAAVLQGMLLLKTLQLVPMASFLLDEVALTESHPNSVTQQQKAVLPKETQGYDKEKVALASPRSTYTPNDANSTRAEDDDDDSGVAENGVTEGRASDAGFSDDALFGRSSTVQTGGGFGDDELFNGSPRAAHGGGGGHSGAAAASPSSQRRMKENPLQAALREVMVVDVEL
jgi:hypothetical protein